MLISTTLIITIFLVTGIKTTDYAGARQLLTFLLNPATVALAVPVYRHRQILSKNLPAIIWGLLAGVSGITLSTALFLKLTGLGTAISLAMLPKAVTIPVAVGISQITGANPSLTIAFVLVTGNTGALIISKVLDWLQIRTPLARGLAMGTSAHGLGTIVALQEGELQGAIAGVAMALTAIPTSILVPLLARLF